MSVQDDVVYLDYAATSAVRPPEVAAAVAAFLSGLGGTPGRGGHRAAVEAGRLALRCRLALARLFNLPGDPGRTAFMLNATHALNTALWGTLRHGDVVVGTAFDHNAVRRPLHALGAARGTEVRVVPGSPDGSVDLEAAADMLRGARLLVVNGASNVLGTALPVARLADLAHEAGALVLLDAAQSAGHLAVDVQAQGIDLLAFTGHKGLLGPQGTGGLWVREGVSVEPLLSGGSGGDSFRASMPDALPDRLEAGTQNAPGLAGLLAGIEWVERAGVQALHASAARLKARLREGLSRVAGVRVLSPPAPDGTGVVSIVAAGLAAGRLAQRLDSEFGVMARAGLHCAPGTHALLGTQESGALRFSVGWASTDEDVDAAIRAVAQILSGAGTSVAGAGSRTGSAPPGPGDGAHATVQGYPDFKEP